MDNETLSREVLLARLKGSARLAQAVPPNPHLDHAKTKLAEFRKKKSSPPDKRVFGPAPVAFVKRLLRLPIFWYVNPIAKQQADVNSIQYEILIGMCATIDGLRDEVAALRKQILRLSSRSDGR